MRGAYLAFIVHVLAAAVGFGLRLWIPGLVIWAIGHAAAGYDAT